MALKALALLMLAAIATERCFPGCLGQFYPVPTPTSIEYLVPMELLSPTLDPATVNYLRMLETFRFIYAVRYLQNLFNRNRDSDDEDDNDEEEVILQEEDPDSTEDDTPPDPTAEWWLYVGNNCRYKAYLGVENEKTFDDAKAECEKFGARLSAKIRDPTTRTALFARFTFFGSLSSAHFLPISLEWNDNNWYWSDGQVEIPDLATWSRLPESGDRCAYWDVDDVGIISSGPIQCSSQQFEFLCEICPA